MELDSGNENSLHCMKISKSLWKWVWGYRAKFQDTLSYSKQFYPWTPNPQIFTSLRVYIQDTSTNVHNSFAYNGLKMERDHNGFSDIH